MFAFDRTSSRFTHVYSLAATLVLLGCGSSQRLTVRPSQPAPVDTTVSPKLNEHAYRKVLLLPPERGVDARDAKVASVRKKSIDYYMAKLERLLLAKGFEVISPEIVARAGAEVGGKSGQLSAAEKALILGQKTKADAVLMLQSTAARSSAKYFRVEEERTTEIEPARVRRDEGEDHPLHKDTKQCLHEVPYYEVIVEAKLIDASSGTVLWVGSGRQSTIDTLRDSWVADVDGDCEVLKQSYPYHEELAADATLERTVSALFERLVAPLAKSALSGKPVEVAAAPPPPPAAEPPPAKNLIAVVSSQRAALRDGASKRNPRLKDVPRKAKVEVIETMGEWMKVKLQDGTVGWMHESMLIVND
jgi:hypothetical protein